MTTLPLISIRSDDACYLTADGPLLFIHTEIDGPSETTLEWTSTAEIVSAVVHRQQILLVDRSPRLLSLDLDTREIVFEQPLAKQPEAVIVADDGTIAVVTSGGAELFTNNGDPVRGIDAVDATCAAFDSSAKTITIGTTRGEVLCSTLEGQVQGRTTLDFPVDAITWHPDGLWLASGEGIVKLDRNCTKSSHYVDSPKGPTTGVTASTSGHHIAYRVGDDTVRVIDWKSDSVVQQLRYPGGFLLGGGTFQLGQLDFGSDKRFVIALGSGEANLINPAKDDLYRGDLPASRPKNRWAVEHITQAPKEPVVSKGAKWTFIVLLLPVLAIVGLILFTFAAVFFMGE